MRVYLRAQADVGTTWMHPGGLPDAGAEGRPASTDIHRRSSEMRGSSADVPSSGESLRQEPPSLPIATSHYHAGGGESLGEPGGGTASPPPTTSFLSQAGTSTAGSALCSGANSQQADNGEDTDSLEPVEDESYYPSGTPLAPNPHQPARTPTAAAQG